MTNSEPTIESERIYQAKTVGLRVDTVQLSDSLVSKREVVEHGWSVVIVPLDG